MGLISDNTIDQVLDSADMVDVIGRSVKLKPQGSNYVGLSPFQEEKSPSFNVVPGKRFWKDFSSGKSGNVIQFIQEKEGLTFPDAVRQLAQEYGIEVEYDGGGKPDPKKKDHREELQKVSTAAARWFQRKFKELPEDHPAKTYVKAWRQISDDSITTFGIGWAPESWDELSNIVTESGTWKPAEELGLVRMKKGKGYDFFRGRIMFPIHDQFGQVIGFTGRVLDDAKPKYMNSQESALFNKSKALYGLHQARAAIRREKCAIITEGQVDVIMSHQCGLDNTIAASGGALTPDHARILSRYTNEAIIWMDPDVYEDGEGAKALKAFKALKSAGMRVKICTTDMDPDEWLRENQKEMIS